jgi:hypothetical protein
MAGKYRDSMVNIRASHLFPIAARNMPMATAKETRYAATSQSSVAMRNWNLRIKPPFWSHAGHSSSRQNRYEKPIAKKSATASCLVSTFLALAVFIASQRRNPRESLPLDTRFAC